MPAKREARQERRETQRRVDTGQVHVGDSAMDIPGTTAHINEMIAQIEQLQHRGARGDVTFVAGDSA